MRTNAAVPRSPFVPRMAQPPYSCVGNFTRAEPDRLELSARRAMVDVEPYGSGDFGGDPSDDELPSLWSASLSEHDEPEDPKNLSDKKKKEERKGVRPQRRCSKEAMAIATSRMVTNLPDFTGKDLRDFADTFDGRLRMTG